MEATERLEEFSRAHGLEDVSWEEEIAQVPSPSWWASDNMLIRGRSAEHGPVLAKVMSRHAWSWRNRHNMIRAAVAAGEAGVGPRVHANDHEIGIVMTEYLGDDWRVARLDRFLSPDFRAELARVRREFAATQVELDRRSPMIDLLQLREDCDDRGFDLDPRLSALIAELEPLREPLLRVRDGLDFHPSQGEATTSNIMVHSSGRVMLVGWGSAAQLSPLHDAALIVSEVCPTVVDADALITELVPDASVRDRAVIKAVAVVEHLRWALLTTLRSRQDPDVSLDSIKYGLWRMTLAEIALADGSAVREWEGALA